MEIKTKIKEYCIDCSRLNDKEHAHEYLKKVFDLPDYYGNNLDALHDCLTERPGFILKIKNPQALGDYGRKVLSVLKDAAEEAGGEIRTDSPAYTDTADSRSENPPARVILKKGEGRSLKAGGSWIYDNEVDCVVGAFEDGDIVRVADFDGYPMGVGFINSRSVIAVRMLTRDADAKIDDAFIEKRVRDAWEYRKKTVDTSSCRLIFGEADFLPGIVVDKFEDVIVVESLALGIDKLKLLIIDKLKEVLARDGINIRGVYERSDAKVREKEGLERTKGFIGDEFDTRVTICENGVKYIVNVEDGQKTGFFLDQKYNRLAMQKFCRDADVLDCFTHTGSFALNAAYAGAKSVLGVDASDVAIAQARENAALNGWSDRVRFEEADIFDFLPSLEAEGKQYDVVILDPPAFTKSKDTIKKAVKGYREINIRGMKLVKDHGYLATCSCSHFMDTELFLKTVQEAAKGAHVRLRMVESRQQAPDHPILMDGSENSFYLKFFIFQIIRER